jgi:hypothetical protein
MFTAEPNPADPRDRRNLSSITPVLEAFAHDYNISLDWFVNDNASENQGWYNLYWEDQGRPCRIVVRLEDRGRPTINIFAMVNVYSPSERCWFCFKEDSPAKMRDIIEQVKQFAESVVVRPHR